MNILKSKKIYPNIKTIGIGLTNQCNLNCPHCYSRNMTKNSFNSIDIKKILSAFPILKSVNFGTGESILNDQFDEIVDLFYKKKIKLALTSNGLSVNNIKETTLKKFSDVDISIDFPTPCLHDKWRGKKGLFNEAIRAIKRCKKHDINVSIATVLMSSNCKYIDKFKKIIDYYDINLRINVYKPVNGEKKDFSPSYDQFWNTINKFSKKFKLVSCSEPILALVSDMVKNGSPCGNSIRIHPDGTVSSCVYIKNSSEPAKFNKEKAKIPDFCQQCPVVLNCMGGCYGRRMLENRKFSADTYCPIYNNKKIPKINFKKAKSKEFIHANYLCTIILR